MSNSEVQRTSLFSGRNRFSLAVASVPLFFLASVDAAPVVQVDATELTLLPGLIDSHFHIGDGEEMYDLPPLFLSRGVTSARDPGRPIEVYARFIRSSRPALRLFLCGPHFDQEPPAWPRNAVLLTTSDEAREAVRRYAKQGASAIKVYFRLPLELIIATCEEAHSLGIPVTAHLELVIRRVMFNGRWVEDSDAP